MSCLEELLPELRKGAKIRKTSWGKDTYIYYKNGTVFDNLNEPMYRFTSASILGDEWELYQEPETDWDYIIKNKCLCWLWNMNSDIQHASFLEGRDEYGRFETSEGSVWEKCRPVCKDEVTFYEDREDDD